MPTKTAKGLNILNTLNTNNISHRTHLIQLIRHILHKVIIDNIYGNYWCFFLSSLLLNYIFFGSLGYQPGYGVGAIYGRYRTTDIDLGTEDTDEPVEAIDKNDEDDRVIIQIPYLANQGIHHRFKRDVDETEEKENTSKDIGENEKIRITYNPLALYPTTTDSGLLHLQSRDNKPSKGAILLGGLAAGNWL